MGKEQKTERGYLYDDYEEDAIELWEAIEELQKIVEELREKIEYLQEKVK